MRYLRKFNESFNKTPGMSLHYGADVISECDLIIDDIKDMMLELTDTGLITTVGYTPMTLVYQDKNPKISAEVTGGLEICQLNDEEIISTFDRIKEYVKSKGYTTGFGYWERGSSFAPMKIYQMLIQK